MNREAILALCILALVIIGGVLWIRGSTHAAREAEAMAMSETLARLLREYRYGAVVEECENVGGGAYNSLDRCLAALLANEDYSSMFTERRFQNGAGNVSGFLIIEKTRGAERLESGKFVLALNNAEISRGCTTPGTIEPGFTCRLDFNQTCVPGDNLEVTYDGKRAHLRTC